MNTLLPQSQTLNPTTETNQPHYYKLMEHLKRLGQRIAKYFTSQSEIKVWQCQDLAGNIYWQVYDPNTNRSAAFGTENEVRIWIEELFYQKQHQSIYRVTDYDYQHFNQFR